MLEFILEVCTTLSDTVAHQWFITACYFIFIYISSVFHFCTLNKLITLLLEAMQNAFKFI